MNLNNVSNICSDSDFQSVLGKQNIIKMEIEDIPRSQINSIKEVPDYYSEYQLPLPIVVEHDGKFLVIGGFDKIQGLPETVETVNCLKVELTDNSLLSIYIEKVALYVRPTGGTASCGEIIRGVSSLNEYLKISCENNMIEGHGGVRRGKNFEEMESKTKVLSDRLGKSVSTVKNYIYYGKYLNQETLEILARNKANRKFFEDFQAIKTKFIRTITGKSNDEMTKEVSQKVLEYWEEYSSSNKNNSKTPDSKQDNSARTILTTNQLNTQSKLEGVNEEETLINENKTTDASVTDSKGTPVEKQEETAIPEPSTVLTHLDTAASMVEKRSKVTELGKRLVQIGSDELNPEMFTKEIEEIISTLLKLFSNNQTTSSPFQF